MKFLKTNLEGKVRNLPHFKGEALLPVFEAVVNSIQAIEERGNLSGGEIEVRVVREAQGMLGDMDESGITGFVITDNGIGFDEANYDSFETSDSIHKQALGGKGKGPRGQAWFIKARGVRHGLLTSGSPVRAKGGCHSTDCHRFASGSGG